TYSTPPGVSMRPTTTFGWSFRMRQSGRVRRWSGSPSPAIARSRLTPAATHARSPAGPDTSAVARSVSIATGHLQQKRLQPIERRRPREALGARARRARKRGPIRTERPRERPGERGQVLRVVDHELGERPGEQLRRARAPARHDRHACSARLEHDVPERLLARRHADDIGRRKDRFDVTPRPGHDDPPALRRRLPPPAPPPPGRGAPPSPRTRPGAPRGGGGVAQRRKRGSNPWRGTPAPIPTQPGVPSSTPGARGADTASVARRAGWKRSRSTPLYR